MKPTETTNLQKLGLIAGMDKLPLIFAKSAKSLDIELTAVAFEGYTSPKIKELVPDIHWIKLGQFQKLIDAFKNSNIAQVVMVGKIPQSVALKNIKLDMRALFIIGKLKSKQTEAVLGAIADELKKDGIKLIDPSPYYKPILCEEGNLSDIKPNKEQMVDIKFGQEIARGIGKLDIGQTVVVKNKTVLAVETIEGTDKTIKRAAEYGGENIIVIKMSKPIQDMRYDVPVIGIDTIKLLSEVKAAGLAIEAQKTFIIDKEEVIKEAKKKKLILMAIK
jgi:DUF1009 family protein